MAARSYTSCVSPGKHWGKPAIQVIVAAALVAIVTALAGGGLVAGLAVVVLTAIIAYCRWWLYDRLVCLGGDRCAIGMVVTVEPPQNKSLLDRFDTDYSINLMLAPGHEGITQEDAEKGPQGDLIKKQAGIDDFTGMQVSQREKRNTTACLRAEFEGGGVHDLYLACLAALPFAIAAAAVCAIPVIGWGVCGILGAIAGAIFLIGVIVGLTDTGDPNDVDSTLGEIHQNDATGRGADILVVKGRWVYDSAHAGWNEIHPILACQRIGVWEGSWTAAGITVADGADYWCRALEEASAPLTQDNQRLPEHQWQVHPVVDGCLQGDTHRQTTIKL